MNVPTRNGAVVEPTGAVSSKYGDVTVEDGRFYQGEPVFILRAADAASIAAISAYRKVLAERDSERVPDDFFSKLNAVIAEFAHWQVRNPSLVKLPD